MIFYILFPRNAAQEINLFNSHPRLHAAGLNLILGNDTLIYLHYSTGHWREPGTATHRLSANMRATHACSTYTYSIIHTSGTYT